MNERHQQALIEWAQGYNGYDRIAGSPDHLAAVLQPLREEFRRTGNIADWAGVDLLRSWAFWCAQVHRHRGGNLPLTEEFPELEVILDALRRHPAATDSDRPSDATFQWPHDDVLHAWWVRPHRLLAGEYPGANTSEKARAKVRLLVEAGVDAIVDLTTKRDRLTSYHKHLQTAAGQAGRTVHRYTHPLPESNVVDHAGYDRILARIHAELDAGRTVYVHCTDGRGRTSTVVGCLLAESGLSYDSVIARIAELRGDTRKDQLPWPETVSQQELLRERCARTATAESADHDEAVDTATVTSPSDNRHRPEQRPRPFANLFDRFAPMIRNMTEAELAAEITQPQRLLLHAFDVGTRHIEIAYFPACVANVEAQIAIVGLTPGRQQWRNALVEVRRCLRAGLSEAEALASAAAYAAFSGPMRANLVAMLDSVGVNSLLGLQSTASLWEDRFHLAYFTSALRDPVFVNGQNYSGTPSMFSTPKLRDQLIAGFAARAATLPHAIFVPLGPTVGRVLEFAAGESKVDHRRVLAGVPHPSGANAERIAFFLGRKSRESLSPRVDPDRLIKARAALKAQVAELQR